MVVRAQRVLSAPDMNTRWPLKWTDMSSRGVRHTHLLRTLLNIRAAAPHDARRLMRIAAAQGLFTRGQLACLRQHDKEYQRLLEELPINARQGVKGKVDPRALSLMQVAVDALAMKGVVSSTMLYQISQAVTPALGHWLTGIPRSVIDMYRAAAKQGVVVVEPEEE